MEEERHAEDHQVEQLPAPSDVPAQTLTVGFLPNLVSLFRFGNVLGKTR